jgi:preprotein translocase subunit SecY
MIKNFLRKLGLLFSDKKMRKGILTILGCIVIFRLVSLIPIPGVDKVALEGFLTQHQIFGILNLFSGGTLSQMSIAMLGVGPYITSSIVMQLLTIVSPKLKDMYHNDGEAGRKRFMQLSRFITLPIAIIQGIGLLLLMSKQGIFPNAELWPMMLNVSMVVAGAFFTLWLGEMLGEIGFGSGVSLILFVGIIAGLPPKIGQLISSYTTAEMPLYIAGLVLVVILIAGIIAVTAAERPLSVIYAKQQKQGGTAMATPSYIPFKLNQAGVMPIIFGQMILQIPLTIASFMAASKNVNYVEIGQKISTFLTRGYYNAAIYFVLVVLFTYFYVTITFEPHSMSERLEQNGAYIPGVRPGEPTTKYLGDIVERVTFYGAIFLGVLAVLPVVLQQATGITSIMIGGTSILIVVNVVQEVLKKVNAQLSMREY